MSSMIREVVVFPEVLKRIAREIQREAHGGIVSVEIP